MTWVCSCAEISEAQRLQYIYVSLHFTNFVRRQARMSQREPVFPRGCRMPADIS